MAAAPRASLSLPILKYGRLTRALLPQWQQRPLLPILRTILLLLLMMPITGVADAAAAENLALVDDGYQFIIIISGIITRIGMTLRIYAAADNDDNDNNGDSSYAS